MIQIMKVEMLVKGHSTWQNRPVLRKNHKYELYEHAVQDPGEEVKLLRNMYEHAFRRRPHLFREDFCATFLLAVEWVRLDPKNRAMAIDKDAVPLRYGREKHLSKLSEDQKRRLTLFKQDVRRVTRPGADIILSPNFSGLFMKTRRDLLEYLHACHASLNKSGIMVFDLLGGSEQGGPNQETRRCRLEDGRRFTYTWEQTDFNPINHEATYFIHFGFPDGREMRRAFRYDWRLWSIPEIREAMVDAGFDSTKVYWEGDEPGGGGNGVFTRTEKAENCASWLAYVVGIKR